MQQRRVLQVATLGAFGSPSHMVELHIAAPSGSSNEPPMDEGLLLEGVLEGDWRGGARRRGV